MSISGKKVELVARAFNAVETGVKIILLNDDLLTRLNNDYKKKLVTNGLIDPKTVAEENKVDDVTQWPSVTLGSIFSFILKVKDFITFWSCLTTQWQCVKIDE